MQTINRQALAERIHANAVAKGFWPTNEDGARKYSLGHYAMLAITELSGAVEADRKGRKADKDAYLHHCHRLNENYINHYGAHNLEALRYDIHKQFERYIKDSVEDELADAYIRILDLSAGYRVTLFDRFVSGISYKEDRLTERILRVVGCVVVGDYSQALDRLEDLANDLGIDLAWHIEEKMRYNESRPARHGKEY